MPDIADAPVEERAAFVVQEIESFVDALLKTKSERRRTQIAKTLAKDPNLAQFVILELARRCP